MKIQGHFYPWLSLLCCSFLLVWFSAPKIIRCVPLLLPLLRSGPLSPGSPPSLSVSLSCSSSGNPQPGYFLTALIILLSEGLVLGLLSLLDCESLSCWYPLRGTSFRQGAVNGCRTNKYMINFGKIGDGPCKGNRRGDVGNGGVAEPTNLTRDFVRTKIFPLFMHLMKSESRPTAAQKGKRPNCIKKERGWGRAFFSISEC